MWFRVKRYLALVTLVGLFIAYWLATDPDTHFFQNLPFGSELIILLGIYLVAIFGIIVIEFIPDYFLDVIYGKETILREEASRSDIGSGLVLIAKSLRILGYSIVLAASIIALNV